MRFAPFLAALILASAISAAPRPEDPASGEYCSIDAHKIVQQLALAKQVTKSGVFNSVVSSETLSKYYNTGKDLVVKGTEKGRNWLGAIGAAFALPTICGVTWTAVSGLLSGSIVYTGLATTWALGTAFFSPLMIVAMPLLGASLVLGIAGHYEKKVFYTAEAYSEYADFLNTELEPLYRVANGLKPQDAIPKISSELQKKMTPELIRASLKWCELNKDKYPDSAKELSEVMGKLDRDQLKKDLDQFIKKAEAQEMTHV